MKIDNAWRALYRWSPGNMTQLLNLHSLPFFFLKHSLKPKQICYYDIIIVNYHGIALIVNDHGMAYIINYHGIALTVNYHGMAS